MYYTYASCANITTAICGDQVTEMIGTYGNCVNLTTAACGPSVTLMDSTYSIPYGFYASGRYKNNNGIPGILYSEETGTIGDTWYGCSSLTEAVCGDSVVMMVNTYRECTNLTTAASGPVVTLMDNTYTNCFVPAVVPDNSLTAYNLYSDGLGLVTPICGPLVQEMRYTYANCQSLTSFVCGAEVKIMDHTYALAESDYSDWFLGDETYTITENRTAKWRQSVSAKRGPTTPVCGANVTDMIGTYKGRHSLTSAVCGANVVNMIETYAGCAYYISKMIEYYNATWASGEDPDYDTYNYSMDYLNYSSGITTAVCGANVINMHGAYMYCSGITNKAACGANVVDMSYAYAYCGRENYFFNGKSGVDTYGYGGLNTPVVGANVVNMQGAYMDCYPIGTAKCGANVEDMSWAYYNCRSLTTGVSGANVTNMSYTYGYCLSLKGNLNIASEYVYDAYGIFEGRGYNIAGDEITPTLLNIRVPYGSTTFDSFYNEDLCGEGRIVWDTEDDTGTTWTCTNTRYNLKLIGA